jgi:ubiquinol-cytochrome c reductase iron-sulfur subunit
MITEEWRGQPVWVINRTKEMLDTLEQITGELVDPNSEVASQQPEYAVNQYRSRRPEIAVIVGLCTHLGCSPTEKLAPGASDGVGDDWPGGFFCACHGSKFDLAGRVYKNVPAPTNLRVPPYKFLSDTLILVGDDSEETA